MASNGISCESCSFFVMLNAKSGNCRANPPHPFLIPGLPNQFTPPGQPNIVVQAVWPPVGVNDWCGRHNMFAVSSPIDSRLAAGADGQA